MILDLSVNDTPLICSICSTAPSACYQDSLLDDDNLTCRVQNPEVAVAIALKHVM
jgi:hypothetical protein